MNSTELPQFFIRHLEALGRLWQVRLELTVSSWRTSLERTDDRGVRRCDVDDEAIVVGGIERALRRASRFVPGTTCIHRALAARRMLARRGIDGEVVIGLRKRSEELEGHAWIEVRGDDERLRAFFSEGDEYIRCAQW